VLANNKTAQVISWLLFAERNEGLRAFDNRLPNWQLTDRARRLRHMPVMKDGNFRPSPKRAFLSIMFKLANAGCNCHVTQA
jgi:hypothetical protein